MTKRIFLILVILFGYKFIYSQVGVCNHSSISLIDGDGIDTATTTLIQNIESNYVRNFPIKTIKKKNPTSIILPIVVHIIHDGGPENISDAQVILGVQHLNEAFSNSGDFYNIDGYNTGIQFCLAKRDTLGNEINGIIRHQSSLTDMSTHFSNIKISQIAHLDPNQYINIRIVKKSCLGTNCMNAGYAVAANQGSQAFRNGVTVQFDYFSNNTINDNVLTHEMGHFLGLYHTFFEGCKNDNCLEDGDKVCDTPPDQRVGEHCLTPSNSCTTDEDDNSINNPFRSIALGGLGDQNDLHTNFMDYNFKECRMSFTQGQADRMMFFIETLHAHLLDSKACLPPCLNATEISCNLTKSSYEVGEVIILSTINNNTSTTSWYLNGIPVTDPATSINNLQSGHYTLNAIAQPLDSNCDIDTCHVAFDIICPINVNIDFTIEDSTVIYRATGVGTITQLIEIKDFEGISVYNSTILYDTVTLATGSYNICIKAGNGLCVDSLCKTLVVNPHGIELCNNGLDDDGDSYVDQYDADCPCGSLFNNSCFKDCQSVTIDTSFKMIKKWQSEKIGDSYNTVVVYDSLIFSKKLIGSLNISIPDKQSSILTINGNSGNTILDIPYTNADNFNSGSVPNCIFKWNDTVYHLLQHFDTLMLFDQFWNKKWFAVGIRKFGGSGKSIADINYDGIPEIIIGNKIISIFNGKSLLDDSTVLGGNTGGPGGFPIGMIPSGSVNYVNSVVADFLPKPGLEIAAGNVVYEINLTNNLSNVGNTMIANIADAPVQNGITSTGDIDGDGLLDVIVVRNRYYIDGGGIYVWNPRTGSMIAQAPSSESGSVAFSGDVDGDCRPEIGVVFSKELRMYKFDGSQNLVLMYSLPTTDESGFTGITMFDFNQDGRNELVYRDETTLRVIEGATGKTIASTPMQSGTSMEYPVIVDIDFDGQAEILTTGYMPGETERDSRVYCFESGGTPWAPARSVWNQYGYHVTNVNDDLTIPRHQQNMAQFFDTDSCAQETCPQPYNAYMTQATYRTQKGCRVWPALPDLEVGATVSCAVDSLEICFILKGRPDTMTFIPISCYPGGKSTNPGDPTFRLALETRIIENQDTFCFRVPRMEGLDSMVIVINDNGSAGWMPLSPTNFSTDKIECRYDNNFIAIDLPQLLPSIDLGPDQTACVGKVITLFAEEGYTTYRWSDESTSDSYTTGDKGFHWVEATDACGLLSKDTVHLDIIPAFSVDLGDDQHVCPSDVITLSYNEPYDQLFWLPSGRVSCDTCATTTFIGTADTMVSIFVIRDGCISSDTMIVDYIDISRISLGPDSRLCLGLIDSFNISFPYDSLQWSPSNRVTCDQCFSTKVVDGTDFTLSVVAYKDGCETRDTVEIGYINQVNITRRINLCENETFTYGDSTWMHSGQYVYKVGQCDSLITFEIQTFQDAETIVLRNVCAGDSTLIGGEWRSQAGVYTDILKTSNGCDSLVRVTLDILPTKSITQNIEICTGKIITIHGINHTQAGTYTNMFTAANGCDSTSTVILTIAPPISLLDSLWICQNESAVIHGQVCTSQNLYTQVFKTSEGCDSTSSVYLTVSPFKVSDRTYSLCNGDSIFIMNRFIKNAGVYIDTIVVSEGCDEIIRHRVNSLPSSMDRIIDYLCPDVPLERFDSTITKAGIYTFTFTNSFGCDSIIMVDVMAVLPSLPPVVDINCEIPEYTVTIPKVDDWWYLDQDAPNGIALEKYRVGSLGDTLRISASSIYFCDKDYLTILPPIPSSTEIPQLAEQSGEAGSGINVAIPLTIGSWKVSWSPSALTSCDTCLTTTITTDRDTTMEVTLTHSSGCIYTRSFRIDIEGSSTIVFPNIFNPSGTANPKWEYRLPLGYKLLEALVYDRWGNQVFHQESFDIISWDGLHHGQEVATGVYIYFVRIFNLQGQIEVFKGDVTVIR